MTRPVPFNKLLAPVIRDLGGIRDLAAAVGISRPLLSLWLDGRRSLSNAKIRALIDELRKRQARHYMTLLALPEVNNETNPRRTPEKVDP